MLLRTIFFAISSEKSFKRESYQTEHFSRKNSLFFNVIFYRLVSPLPFLIFVFLLSLFKVRRDRHYLGSAPLLFNPCLLLIHLIYVYL